MKLDTVYNEDCLLGMQRLPDNSVDAVVTDPPYGMNLVPQRGRTKAIIGDRSSREAKALWASAIPECFRIAKANTAHIFFSRWSEGWAKEILDQHFKVKGSICWVKNVFGIGYYLRPQWEMAYYCHKGSPPKPAKALSDVWTAPRVHKPIHSCEKPVDLIAKAIIFCSQREDTVIDPFLGVGTTAIACINTGRHYIGFEKDPEYFRIAQNRIREHFRQCATRSIAA